MPITATYGSWKSPVTTDQLTANSVGLGQIALDGDDVYWVEMRPSEGGRMVIVKRTPDGELVNITPDPFSARTKVHEYGGGAFLVADGTVFFSNFSDQRLYRQDRGEEPRPITPEGSFRYADGHYDWELHRIVCVREEHGDGEPINAIVSVDAEGEGPEEVLYDGSDFCSTPRISPDGSTLAWLAWDHPNMPWDGVWLMTAIIYEDGRLGEVRVVAGGDDESIFQPEWSPKGVLHFVSDRSGWWNLYSWEDGKVNPLAPMEAEFGKPQWVFGAAAYGFVSPEGIVCSYVESGTWKIALLDSKSGTLVPISTPYSEMGRGDLKARNGRVVFTAGAPTAPMTMFLFDLNTGEGEALRRAHELEVDPGYLSVPESIEFPTTNGNTAHAFYYAPQNPDFQAPRGEKAPLLVKSHGGPTGAASTALDLVIQFWTSRGIGVLDVNYGGSTGYGTGYRRRLNGAWGVVDVEDCANAALHLVERGDADEARLAIDGGSAGGYTTLASLTFREVFKAGASYYGVSDLESLAKETHKFESRYLDSLVGPYPERQDLYQERSPINHTHRLSCPLILLQGLEDEIVPPNQAEMMFQAVRDKGLPTAYIPFEGEQHGFRRSENIKRALEAELYFYSRVFGFELADPVTPVEIENLAQATAATGYQTPEAPAAAVGGQASEAPAAVIEELVTEEPPAVVEAQSPEDQTADEPSAVVGELVAEEPVAAAEAHSPEEPVAAVEELVTEEPVAAVDELFTEEPVATVDEPVTEEPAAAVDELFIEEPAAALDERVAEQPLVVVGEPVPSEPVAVAEDQASDEPVPVLEEQGPEAASEALGEEPTELAPSPSAESTKAQDGAPGTDPVPATASIDLAGLIQWVNSVDLVRLEEDLSPAFLDNLPDQATSAASEEPDAPIAPSAPPAPQTPPAPLDTDRLVQMANSVDIDQLAEELSAVFLNTMAEQAEAEQATEPTGDYDPKG